MLICQNLYQDGHITYMRTESCQYSQYFLEKARTFILSKWNSVEFVGNLIALDNKKSLNPHEAIRVTNLENRYLKSDDKRICSVYNIIWKNTIESCMSPALYKNYNISISAPDNLQYLYVLDIPKFMGWKIVDTSNITEQQNKQNGLYLYFTSFNNIENNIQENKEKEVKWNFIESTIVEKTRNGYYTEASLIDKLEELGIGRPSTFSSIVDTIQERGYVKRKNIEGSQINCKEYTLIKNIETQEKKIEET
jgi:DNA topoisomerase-1